MMNNKHRTNAKNEFEKDFFKLMNNSVFGKTMENIREHKDIKLVNTRSKLNKYVREPNIKTSKYFSENLLAVEMRKTEITMNKPVYLGQAILDISKTLMYQFYYDYVKPKYNDKVKLCYMDTDSFILHIFTKDFYEDISNDVDKWFDTSNYSKNTNRTIKTGVNKNKLGFMKDETANDEISEIVNVCAMYAYLKQVNTDDNNLKEEKQAKGIKKCVKKQCLKFQDYVDALVLNKTKRCVQTVIRPYAHNVFTQDVNKIAISAHKRIWIKGYFDMTYQYGPPTLN